MRRVAILYRLRPSSSITWRCTLYPLVAWHRRLRDRGILVSFHDRIDADLGDPDVLIIVDYFFDRIVRETLTSDALEEMVRLRSRAGRLVYFDTTDSCGTTVFEVIPLVDAYWKKQLYTDRSLYARHLYSFRTYCEYYHREFAIDDAPMPPRTLLPPGGSEKLGVAWNLGLGGYGLQTRVARGLLFANGLLRFPVKGDWNRWFGGRGGARREWGERDIDVQYRGAMRYSLATISFGRSRPDELLRALCERRSLELRTGQTLTRAEFLDELRRARAVVSPFGYGEICFRDFEALMAGACLYKPRMDHLETWPDWYRDGETFMSYAWDFSDFEENLERLLDEDQGKRIASQGRALFESHLMSDGAGDLFADRFVALLPP
jgi:hypothetical protein